MNLLGLEDRVWLWLASACYVAGFSLSTAALARGQRHSNLKLYGIVATGFLLQTIGLYLRGRAVRGCPIGNTFEIFQFTAWSAISLYLVIGVTFRLSLLGYFTSCLSAVLTLASLAIPSWDAERRAGAFGGNAWIEFHAALALFSYGVFALLALTSLMFLLQTHSLKHKRLHGLFSFLPSIYDLDRISVRLLLAGVALMTWSIAIGSVHWVRDLSSVNAGKLAATVGVWIAYALVTAFRLGSRLNSTRFAWFCLVLYAGALLSLGPVNASRQPPAPSPAIKA